MRKRIFNKEQLREIMFPYQEEYQPAESFYIKHETTKQTASF